MLGQSAARSSISPNDSALSTHDLPASSSRAGVAGERKIVFELTNSHYPLVFIHDLCLEHEGARAQIDFLVVTLHHTIAIDAYSRL